MRTLKIIEHISLDGVIQHTAAASKYTSTAPSWPRMASALICCLAVAPTTSGRASADEAVLIVSPVLLGTGKRFFAEGTPAHAFELVSTTATPSGVLLNAYKVIGPLKAG